MLDTLAYLRLNDTVEDRSTYSGHGWIVYFAGNYARIEYADGSEEEVSIELFRQCGWRHWVI
jgi:hypothetical protein